MKRFSLSVLLCAALICAGASANTGVAFVHGTGDQTNAAADYWQWNNINSIRQGLPNQNNYTVINCQFSEFMWTAGAAGCLADQLTTFINSKNITDLVIITHSNGANVARWIMSNPTWDSRFPNIVNKTRRVYTVAASSLGTPLADAVTNGNIFETALGWLLGYSSDAVRMQQVSWMAYYNYYWLKGTSGRPALPKPVTNIVGTDVESAIWDGDSYCGGYALNVGLEFTQNWLGSCSDGFLNCSSQAGIADNTIYDSSFTNEPLSHNQSRRKCFGLDVLLRNAL